jgi:nitrite reductase/ring-hydroxylating ferredoxin subunit/alkylhydroperoxidase/carboxymuconolactone decarboxylase family protein YurZ
MSDALTYLNKARPDAIKPYFTFLKQAGTHLDPKTRNLISVITKVHAQTEKGLRQYLTRALREGASAHEILDALLMAFPALGLAKIVWAVDIILDMDIPEFRPEMLDVKPEWHDVAALEEIPADEVSYRDCEGRSLFVYRQDDSLKVYDSRCPHQVTNIPHLALEGTRLTCPKHQWSFDIVSGECIDKGDRPLNEFQHRVENGRLLAYW